MPYTVAKVLVPSNHEAMICLADLGSNLVAGEGWDHRIRLYFQDVDSDTPGSFTRWHANSIYLFLNELPKEIDTIYVHCFAGVSRSAAVTKYIAERYNIEEALEEFRSYTLYNKRIYRILRNNCPVLGPVPTDYSNVGS